MVSTPRALYRHLLRRVALLPTDAQEYYRHRIKQVCKRLHCNCACTCSVVSPNQEFASHSDEADPERIEQIIKRALQDAEWIVQKVNQLLQTLHLLYQHLDLTLLLN